MDSPITVVMHTLKSVKMKINTCENPFIGAKLEIDNTMCTL